MGNGVMLGNRVVPPAELLQIPVGSVIHVGKVLDEGTLHEGESSVWFVYRKGKAEVVDLHYPLDSETEDLDWFKPWEVTVIGFNQEYADQFAVSGLVEKPAVRSRRRG